MTRSDPGRPLVAVVGGGIAGLAAAWELVAGSDAEPPDVHVFESADRVGGKLRWDEIAGRRVDLAADAFLARRPEAVALCTELGLDDQLVPVGSQGASIWARDQLRLMPEGLNLGVPTRWWPLFRSGILTAGESVRVARDLVSPHLRTGTAIGDRTVGEIVGERLGRPVVERLVDPLVGGIPAGGVDDLSAAATFPLLLAASHQSGSLMRRLGRAMAPRPAGPPADPSTSGAPAGGAPAFFTLAGTTASLADLTASALEARGVTIHTGVRVEALGRAGRRGPRARNGPARWQLSLRDTGRPGDASRGNGGNGNAGRRTLTADAVVVAVPAPQAHALLTPTAPVAAGMLGTVQYASVGVVTMAFPAGAVPGPLRGTGFLVPRTSTIEGRAPLITGVTYLGRKWPHLARPGDELIRASVGRFGDARYTDMDDDELLASVLGELAVLLGIHVRPAHSLITRWVDALPQYELGHLIRVGRIDREMAELGTMAVAGAALRGVGIPACIASGRAAGRRMLAALHPDPEPEPEPGPSHDPAPA